MVRMKKLFGFGNYIIPIPLVTSTGDWRLFRDEVSCGQLTGRNAGFRVCVSVMFRGAALVDKTISKRLFSVREAGPKTRPL